MNLKSSASKVRRERIKPLEFDERARVLAEVMNHESDQGCAVIGAQIVSNRLESLLRAFLRDDSDCNRFALDSLFVGYGPLTTFTAKIHMVYAIQLIPKIIRGRLDMIRKIRNHFAHSQVRTSFSDTACAETLLLLANGKTDPPKAREDLNVMRFAYTCAVAQTATVLEFLESIIVKGGDIRANVLRFEEEESFEYDWKKSQSKRAT
jgi:DNA-binding MltR family transcriptional regulator